MAQYLQSTQMVIDGQSTRLPEGRALARRDHVGPLPGEAYWMGAWFLQSDHLREVNDEGDWPDQ